ncbi:hypothetical protein KAU51_00925 [Candidatus Parcubacteria bacterium]|nr:hypothetical protein [Candidatus Parcubacteria bacterium]
MSFSTIILIYLFLFLLCFVFTLRYKARISKHDGDFPETLMKTFVIFVYLGLAVAVGVFLSLPFLISQGQQITRSLDLSFNIASLVDSFTDLLEFK